MMWLSVRTIVKSRRPGGMSFRCAASGLVSVHGPVSAERHLPGRGRKLKRVRRRARNRRPGRELYRLPELPEFPDCPTLNVILVAEMRDLVTRVIDLEAGAAALVTRPR